MSVVIQPTIVEISSFFYITTGLLSKGPRGYESFTILVPNS